MLLNIFHIENAHFKDAFAFQNKIMGYIITTLKCDIFAFQCKKIWDIFRKHIPFSRHKLWHILSQCYKRDTFAFQDKNCGMYLKNTVGFQDINYGIYYHNAKMWHIRVSIKKYGIYFENTFHFQDINYGIYYHNAINVTHSRFKTKIMGYI